MRNFGIVWNRMGDYGRGVCVASLGKGPVNYRVRGRFKTVWVCGCVEIEIEKDLRTGRDGCML